MVNFTIRSLLRKPDMVKGLFRNGNYLAAFEELPQVVIRKSDLMSDSPIANLVARKDPGQSSFRNSEN